jgi:hypothetical protein
MAIVVATVLIGVSAAAAPEQRPCDIYAAGGTPCVAAHSVTRALFKAFDGALYEVRNNHTGATKDIKVKVAGGTADTAAQDAFCGTAPCIVTRIYDQTELGNHLGIEHGAASLSPPRDFQDRGVDMADKAARISLGGQPVFAAVFNGQGHSHTYIGQGYSNRTARGTARGDEAETVYAVVSGRHYNSGCCLSVQRYPAPLGPPPPPSLLVPRRCDLLAVAHACSDYGNGENATKDGKQAGPMKDGTMLAVYFGTGYSPKGPGSGKGPWLGADMGEPCLHSDHATMSPTGVSDRCCWLQRMEFTKEEQQVTRTHSHPYR